MATTNTSSSPAPPASVDAKRTAKHMGRFNRWDTPWLNGKLLTGVAIIILILVSGILGRLLWNTNLAYTGTSPLNLPPVGFVNSLTKQVGTWEHPLGTENSGRDMLALIIVGAPNSFLIGVVAATIGMGIGIVLGFSAGFIGGRVDDVVKLLADVTITIPALMVLIVIQSLLKQVELWTMALLIAAFAWPGPTRLIRSQVLTMRESGYVQMAKLSGASTFSIQSSPESVWIFPPGRYWRRCGWKRSDLVRSEFRHSEERSTLPSVRRRCCGICGGGGDYRPCCWRSCSSAYC